MLIWLMAEPKKLSSRARLLIEDTENDLAFSVTSIWETAIKFARGKPNFKVDPQILRDGALSAGHVEMQVTGEHAIAVKLLPHLHRDPFDRLLIVQARIEGMTLLTADDTIASYGDAVMHM